MFEQLTIAHPAQAIKLQDFDPDETLELSKETVKPLMKDLRKRFARCQEKLYAAKDYALLLVLQGMDCSGKDGTVKKVLYGINPNGFYVQAFKEPTPLELGHDYLWRVHQKAPAKGQIGIFNRSYYEDVLVTRVHGTIDDAVAQRRFAEIRNFEQYLTDNHTIVLKFFLHISKDFQKEKLDDRLTHPDKNWKFSEADLRERQYWEHYQRYYEDVLNNCSTANAPWYIVPADRRWFRNYMILDTIVTALEGLDLHYPTLQGNVDKLIKELKHSDKAKPLPKAADQA
ncbi:MAG: polyphosphate kinase 2 family protein [Oscillospiraceae bacterium]|nr:polyphosphate kinase 2 family protein [Oscillospiraceae bacterium]MDD4367544.1 polyphosphate kinase 2 family protein [Oscillospiraceae bacterium]